MRQTEANIEHEWGGAWVLLIYAPSMVGDRAFADWWATYVRLGASPGAAVALYRMNRSIDIRAMLSSVRIPALVLHRRNDRLIRAGHGHYLADHISGAKYAELPGEDHLGWVGDSDAVVDEVEEFLTGVRPPAKPDRVLATVLFADIVASTARPAELGDRRWRDLLESYYGLMRKELVRFRGQEIGTSGDGFLATFDGPARAIRRALAAVGAARAHGIEIRVGLHAGEIELMGETIGGIAVHIGARVAALAGGGEVLVSSTVKDLVVGSGIEFADRGVHALKGVPEGWRLFAVRSG